MRFWGSFDKYSEEKVMGVNSGGKTISKSEAIRRVLVNHPHLKTNQDVVNKARVEFGVAVTKENVSTIKWEMKNQERLKGTSLFPYISKGEVVGNQNGPIVTTTTVSPGTVAVGNESHVSDVVEVIRQVRKAIDMAGGKAALISLVDIL